MSTNLAATGTFYGRPPVLTVSSGRGNTGKPEIHLSLRDDSFNGGEDSRTVLGWFDRDELLAAIKAEDNRVRRALEVGEPA